MVRLPHAARIGAFILLAALAPAVASAQINPFKSRGANRMTAEDLRMVSAAAAKLLAQDPLPVGTVESWKNDKTGASGSVRAGESVTRHGLSCRQVQYAATSRNSHESRNGELDWCKTQDGTWKIAS